MKRSDFTVAASLALAASMLAACSEPPATESTAAEAPPEATPAGNAAPALPRQPSPDGARVFFISLEDGGTVSSPVQIEFGVEGMEVVRAGEQAPNSGHHHLIINAAPPDMGLPIPADEHYVHFGDASTSTELTLEPGEHTLQLLFGDYLHIPHEPPVMSEMITITVE